MKINPKMIAIPRGPKKLVNPLEPEATAFPVLLDGVEFDVLDGLDETGVPGN